MSQLIPFEKRHVGSETIETVDGRDLHAGLEIRKDYTDWVKAQIKRAQLTENEDFVLFPQQGEKGNRPTIEYFFTFDASKHVAMMSGSKKGKEIRDYFIAKEKELSALHADPYAAIKDPAIKMIIDMAVHLDATRAIAAEAVMAAREAKAQVAVVTDRYRMTIEQFVGVQGLIRQIPRSSWYTMAKWLTSYCATLGWDVPALPVEGRPWREEGGYPIEALMRYVEYLSKKPQQIHLLPRS